MDEEDFGAWVQFSEVALNSRMRNALELFARRSQEVKELPAALGLGAEVAAGLPQGEDGEPCGDELRKLG